MSKYTKSTTVYTAKKEHQKTSNGLTIFENDWSTLTGDTLPISSPTVYNQGNFKIVTNSEPDFSKKYGVGEWLCADGDDDCFWTLDNLNGEDETPPVIVSTDHANDVIILKPDTTQFSTYAYYGSLFELIRSSFEHIVTTFPASLWCRPENQTLGRYELINDFEIDLYTDDFNIPNSTLKTMVGNWFNNYQIVETKYEERSYLGGNVTYGENFLQDCTYSITSFIQQYRYLIGNGETIGVNEIERNVTSGNIRQNVEYKVYGEDLVNDSVTYNGYVYKRGMTFVGVEDTTFTTTGDGYIRINGFIKQLEKIEFNGTSNDDTCENNSIRIVLDYYYYDEVDKCILKNILCSVYDENNTPIIITSSPSDQIKPELSYHIKPKNDIVDLWFSELNDFQKVVLPRYTNPKYTSTFKVPVTNENGTFYTDYQFTWLTPDGWNLDVKSLSYSDFINNLSNISVELDETKTDNLYRMLTHESIKNMVGTSLEINEDGDGEHAEYLEGSDKIAKILRLFGRQFDDIKKYVDSISTVNNVSYDEKANLPDAYLKTLLSHKGWMMISPVL